MAGVCDGRLIKGNRHHDRSRLRGHGAASGDQSEKREKGAAKGCHEVSLPCAAADARLNRFTVPLRRMI
jgi:hypothetical protein